MKLEDHGVADGVCRFDRLPFGNGNDRLESWDAVSGQQLLGLKLREQGSAFAARAPDELFNPAPVGSPFLGIGR